MTASSINFLQLESLREKEKRERVVHVTHGERVICFFSFSPSLSPLASCTTIESVFSYSSTRSACNHPSCQKHKLIGYIVLGTNTLSLPSSVCRWKGAKLRRLQIRVLDDMTKTVSFHSSVSPVRHSLVLLLVPRLEGNANRICERLKPSVRLSGWMMMIAVLLPVKEAPENPILTWIQGLEARLWRTLLSLACSLLLLLLFFVQQYLYQYVLAIVKRCDSGVVIMIALFNHSSYSRVYWMCVSCRSRLWGEILWLQMSVRFSSFAISKPSQRLLRLPTGKNDCPSLIFQVVVLVVHGNEHWSIDHEIKEYELLLQGSFLTSSQCYQDIDIYRRSGESIRGKGNEEEKDRPVGSLSCLGLLSSCEKKRHEESSSRESGLERRSVVSGWPSQSKERSEGRERSSSSCSSSCEENGIFMRCLSHFHVQYILSDLRLGNKKREKKDRQK